MGVKLQEQLSRKIGNKTYSKFVLVVSSKLVKQLHWRNGTEITTEIKKGKLVLKRAK